MSAMATPVNLPLPNWSWHLAKCFSCTPTHTDSQIVLLNKVPYFNMHLARAIQNHEIKTLKYQMLFFDLQKKVLVVCMKTMS